MLLEMGVPASQILAITFTNKAAREMRERIEKLAGDQAGKHVGFHLPLVLLRAHSAPGYRNAWAMSNSFTIYDDDDQMSVLKDILKAAQSFDDKYLSAARDQSKDRRREKRVCSAPDEWFAPVRHAITACQMIVRGLLSRV